MERREREDEPAEETIDPEHRSGPADGTDEDERGGEAPGLGDAGSSGPVG
jgi:hypothetical protein